MQLQGQCITVSLMIACPVALCLKVRGPSWFDGNPSRGASPISSGFELLADLIGSLTSTLVGILKFAPFEIMLDSLDDVLIVVLSPSRLDKSIIFVKLYDKPRESRVKLDAIVRLSSSLVPSSSGRHRP